MSLRTPVSANDHVQGNVHAAIELVEYGDYQCPHCARAYPIIKRLQAQMGDRMKFIFRNFPLAEIHPQAFIAAVAAEASGKQQKFWEMHDIIFENRDQLEVEYLFAYAARIGLDLEQFKDDIQQDVFAAKVESDFESGVRSGVNGTPTFFINGKKYTGSWEGDDLLNYFEKNYPGDKS